MYMYIPQVVVGEAVAYDNDINQSCHTPVTIQYIIIHGFTAMDHIE